MDNDPQLERAHLAARLYYLDGMSQAEVALILELSQGKVSRLLQLARERGIVRISVDEYQPRVPALERELCEAYGLRRAVVIRNVSQASDAGIRRNVGYFGAAAISELLRSGEVIGVTGGRSLAELVRRISPRRTLRDVRVVQLMGSIGAEVNDADAIELSRYLAIELEGSCYGLHMPAFASSPASRAMFLEQPQAEAVWRLYGEMSLAIVGIGTLLDSAFVDRGVLNEADLAQLAAAGAAGEICGRFFDATGSECRTPLRQRVVSIELDALRQVPDVVGVTTGGGRAAGVATAVRAGLVKSLIVDEQCAAGVLALADGESNRRRGTRKRCAAAQQTEKRS